MNITAKLLPFCLATMLAGKASAASPDPLADYYDNTVIWQNQTSRVIGRLWINRDGKYYVFYNMGAQAKPAGINGPFAAQAREGTYTLRSDEGEYQLCLWPAAPRTNIAAATQRELYAEANCYPFRPRSVGDVWTENGDPLNRPYKLWFMSGR